MITAIIITKNNEDLIADCIDSVAFCDEVLVIDDGSTDKTPDIAAYKNARVISYSTGSFAEKRNFGLQKAKYEWIFYIDADERVDKKLESAIKEQIEKRKNDFVAFRVNRKNFYLGNHEWPTIEHLERLFKKKHLKEWVGALHETAKVDGAIGELDGYLLHYTHRDLTSMLQKTIAWSAIEAKLRYDANHPQMTWWRFPRVMFTAFYDSYVKQQGWKVGVVGLIESMFQMFSMFITYARLWEMQHQEKQTKK